MKKIKNLSVFWRRFVLIAVLAVLAVPMTSVVILNYKAKINDLGRDGFSRGPGLQSLQEQISSFSREMKNWSGLTAGPASATTTASSSGEEFFPQATSSPATDTKIISE